MKTTIKAIYTQETIVIEPENGVVKVAMIPAGPGDCIVGEFKPEELKAAFDAASKVVNAKS